MAMTAADKEKLELRFGDKACFAAFFSLLQQGVLIETTAGATVGQILRQYCGDEGHTLLGRIQTLFLNGMPVDDMDSARLKDGDSLALSAAMPGLVGATLRAGGLLAGFRQSISYRSHTTVQDQSQILVRIKLFNILIKELGPELLCRGITITVGDLRRLIRDLATLCKPTATHSTLNGVAIALEQLDGRPWSSPAADIFLTARFEGFH